MVDWGFGLFRCFVLIYGYCYNFAWVGTTGVCIVYGAVSVVFVSFICYGGF